MTKREPKRRANVPAASSEAARNRMLAAKLRDTKPEMELRTALEDLGLIFEVDIRPSTETRRRADIVFEQARLAVYVDGCFWHGCPIHGTWPKQNAEFWRNKIETNRRRDADTDRRLQVAGWRVVRIWEHEDIQDAAQRIIQLIQAPEEH